MKVFEALNVQTPLEKAFRKQAAACYRLEIAMKKIDIQGIAISKVGRLERAPYDVIAASGWICWQNPILTPLWNAMKQAKTAYENLGGEYNESF